jgi:hypothetical protein
MFVSTKYRPSLKMGHLGSNAKTKKKLVNTLVAAVLIQVAWKSVRKVVLMISRSSLNIGHL